MNKALEVIEARWLYDFGDDQVDVVVQPQSIVHSLVEFADGSLKAQLGLPDMRIPIQYALTYPDHLASPAPRVLAAPSCRPLSFEPPDDDALSGARDRARRRPPGPPRERGADRRGRRRRRPFPEWHARLSGHRRRCAPTPSNVSATAADAAAARRAHRTRCRGPRLGCAATVTTAGASAQLMFNFIGLGNGLINVALLLVILVALVVIHEFGHFVVARRAGVTVHEFGIGFPPRARRTTRTRRARSTRSTGCPSAASCAWKGRRASRTIRTPSSASGCAPGSRSCSPAWRMNILLAFVIFTGIAAARRPGRERAHRQRSAGLARPRRPASWAASRPARDGPRRQPVPTTTVGRRHHRDRRPAVPDVRLRRPADRPRSTTCAHMPASRSR